MRRFTVLSFVCLALSAGPAPAVLPAPANPPLPAKGRGAVEKACEGRVTEFAAGRVLTIALENGKAHSIRLDEKDVEANVDRGVAVGARVRVVEARDADGRRTVKVELAASPPQAG